MKDYYYVLTAHDPETGEIAGMMDFEGEYNLKDKMNQLQFELIEAEAKKSKTIVEI